jgi:hypothetical protein
MVEVSSAVVADSPDHALCREAQQVGLMLLKVLQQLMKALLQFPKIAGQMMHFY